MYEGYPYYRFIAEESYQLFLHTASRKKHKEKATSLETDCHQIFNQNDGSIVQRLYSCCQCCDFQNLEDKPEDSDKIMSYAARFKRHASNPID